LVSIACLRLQRIQRSLRAVNDQIEDIRYDLDALVFRCGLAIHLHDLITGTRTEAAEVHGRIFKLVEAGLTQYEEGDIDEETVSLGLFGSDMLASELASEGPAGAMLAEQIVEIVGNLDELLGGIGCAFEFHESLIAAESSATAHSDTTT
jgi:hypothetical protein